MIPLGEERRVPVVPIAVYAIIALNVYVFLLEVSGPSDALINSFALVPYDITHHLAPVGAPRPDALTLITSQFLHGSVLHIVFNMIFLAVFGPHIEYLTGHARFIVFYLACGIVGGLAQTMADPASHIPSIGASGAIAGVLGAYIVRFPAATINTLTPIGCFPLFLRLPAVLVIGVWAVTQFMHGFGAINTRVATESGDGIAYFAHIGGFLTGLFAIGLFARRRGARPNW